MKIVISGGTGFLGRPLTDALAHDGHSIVVLTRGTLIAMRELMTTISENSKRKRKSSCL